MGWSSLVFGRRVTNYCHPKARPEHLEPRSYRPWFFVSTIDSHRAVTLLGLYHSDMFKNVVQGAFLRRTPRAVENFDPLALRLREHDVDAPLRNIQLWIIPEFG